MDFIDRVTRIVLEHAKSIEDLPTYDYLKFNNELFTAEDLRSYRYPFERGLHEYLSLLPQLASYLRHDLRVLDIGAGNGKAALELEKTYQCQVVATGIKEVPDADFPIEIVEASNLPYPENHFDLVIAVHSISWSPNQRQSLNEIVRVLKPGGKAAIFLIPFSHSAYMWYGEHFWEDHKIDRNIYLDYEFRPDLQINSCNLIVNKLEASLPIGNYKYCYQTYIEKD